MRDRIAPVGRLLEREAVVFAKLWHAFAFSTFVMPALFLAAMGVGLGGLVDDRQGAVAGLSYLHFVTPGLLVAAAMQQAAGETMWPVLGGVKWDNRYAAMVSAPISAYDVYVCTIAYVALRTAASVSAFLLVAWALGGLASPWAVLALPAGVLCAVAFAAPIAAWAITQQTDVVFAMVMRLGVMPLFLFSGTFFPVSTLPSPVRPLAWLSPLWHGVELARAATTGHGALGASLAHVLFLLVCVVAGAAWGRRTFAARLTP